MCSAFFLFVPSTALKLGIVKYSDPSLGCKLYFELSVAELVKILEFILLIKELVLSNLFLPCSIVG